MPPTIIFSGLSGGAIVGIVISLVLLLLATVAVVILVIYCRRKRCGEFVLHYDDSIMLFTFANLVSADCGIAKKSSQ